MDNADFLNALFGLEGMPRYNADIKYFLESDFRPQIFDLERICPGPRNRHGYRSDEFEPRGDYNILFVGCSWTEGQGVPRGSIYPDLVARTLAQRTGKTVRAWNLGSLGRGAEYIARIVSSSVDFLRPDLVIAVYSTADRREFFDLDGRCFCFLNVMSDFMRQNPKAYTPVTKSLVKAFHDLTSSYSDLAVLAMSLRLLSATLDLRKIPWGISAIANPAASHPFRDVIGSGIVDPRRYTGFLFDLLDTVPGDGAHPYLESHRVFAGKLADWIEARYLSEPHKVGS
ncbi:MAG: hypothetical protein HZC25_08285 [Rhodospirillales bacterium]|nr:hypothetical protein [Rhodospirillales bacterium]